MKDFLFDWLANFIAGAVILIILIVVMVTVVALANGIVELFDTGNILGGLACIFALLLIVSLILTLADL